ncbi:MAG: InlB B-repeat-containing protein [Myxococcales bacterium]|nr:InlB B-repeat-containing protein [Myxococcales bacterium]
MRPYLVSLVAVLALAACGQVTPPISDAPMAPDASVDGMGDPPDGPSPDGAEPVPLTVAATGAGTVTSTPAGISCGATCSASFPAGSQVTLTATADAGNNFAGWTGACTGNQPTCTLTLAAATSVTASFAPVTFTVTTALVGNGAGTVTASPASLGLSCPPGCTATVAYDTPITLTATPTGSSLFVGWSGGTCTGTGPCTFNVRADVTINAAFALNYTLVVTRTGTGTGTVTSAPAGISCGADCDETYSANAMVTLTAAPDPSSTFAGWTGGGCTGTGACTVTMDAAKTVAAQFTLRQYVLTASVSGTGAGTITSNPVGIACGATCAATYDHGTMVALTATAGGTSAFTGWTGACSGVGACVVTMDQARSVGAIFTINSLALSVSKTGTGAGTVTSTPAGIACGATCTSSFNAGQMITLTAAPATGSTFTGWAGGGCSGVGGCTVTLTSSTTVTATFTLDRYTLTLAPLGTGAAYASITSAPAGINCGTDCAELYDHGTTVTLTASGGAGATFDGWPATSGCSGTGTCVVTIAAATTISPRFTLRQYTVTAAVAGAGTGTVTSSPSGISCPGTCARPTDYASTITLTATPSAGGHTFNGWSGAGCTGTGPCVITVTGAVTATATFGPPPNFAFVTSTTRTGNLGGLAGADAICQAAATAVNLAGTYRAWLSTSTVNASSRLAPASGWVRVDGKPFVNTVADLTSGRIFYPLVINERGGNIVGSTVWTGTSSSGVLSGTACTNWTDGTTAGLSASIGFNEYGTSGWTQNGGGACTGSQHLYCFGVDRTATVAPPPATAVRRAFVSSAAWLPNGGLAGADVLCASEASAAGLTGSFRALLATTGASAASRFSTAGNPWARVDDVVLAPTAAGFLGGAAAGPPTFWDAALNVTAARGYGFDRTWAGAATVQTAGTGTSCTGWSTVANTVFGAVGLAASTRTATAFANYTTSGGITTCDNAAHKIMCLQQ